MWEVHPLHSLALPKGQSQYRFLPSKNKAAAARAGGGGALRMSLLYEETVMEVDVNDSRPTAWMYLVLLESTLNKG